MVKSYYLHNIRTFLVQGFDVVELRNFCQDNPLFKSVYEELAQYSGSVEVVDRLLGYANRKLLLDDLLAWAREQNPERYLLHGPYDDISVANANATKIQVAIIAMTRLEAIELVAETIFSDLKARESWQKLKEVLQRHLQDFTLCYDESRRDGWRPLIKINQKSIWEIIEEDVVKELKEQGRAIINLENLSTMCLSPNDVERDQAWEKLATYGGILIVDAISMCHPQLRRYFVQLIGSNRRIAVIVVVPRNDHEINELLENEIYIPHLGMVFRRFAKHFDPIYEFGVGDLNTLHRRLGLILLNCMDNNGLDQSRRAAIRAQRGQSLGIGQVAVGGLFQ